MKTLVVISRNQLLGVLSVLAVGAAAPPQSMAIAPADHVVHTKVAGIESHDASNAQAKVNRLSQRSIVEKVDGKQSSVTVLEVILEPGQHAEPHRHAGPVFGYVLEGQYKHAINDEPVKLYNAGCTFYEPTGCLHRVAQNPSNKARTRLLAVIVHPADIKDPTMPDHGRR